jgi:hypothetical protein
MAKSEYVSEIYKRYKKARSRAEKSRLLDEICATCGVHRKHALRLLRRHRDPQRARPRKRGRPSRYRSAELLRALRKIWLAANLPCSKRLKAILPLWLPGYEKVEEPLAADVREKLLALSPATIDRLLERTRLQHTTRGRSTTKPGTLLRNKIPINTGQWQESRPGFIEADTVAHCGTTTAGLFAFTVDCVDIATGWSEQRALWGKEDKAMVEQMRSIERALPFPLLGFDSDNGSEFLNHLLFKHFVNRKKPVVFTRSRAYRKDDNAHVEQKNWTHVRQWLGYDRLDNPLVVEALNDLYTNEWRLFHNFYCPSVKLLSKERVGSKTIKKHDSPKTPYQRVLESEHISAYAKEGLRRIYQNTNPFVLRRAMEKRIKRVFALGYKEPVSHEPEALAR